MMKNILPVIAAVAVLGGSSLARTQTVQAIPAPPPQSEPLAKCSSVEKDALVLQRDALKGMRSSVGQTARDFCTALDKSENRAMTDNNRLLSDILGLIKKHAGADVDIKSISRMCMENQNVPAKALDEQIAALERAIVDCQDPI